MLRSQKPPFRVGQGLRPELPGYVLILLHYLFSCFFSLLLGYTFLIPALTLGLLFQVGKGLSKDEKAQKLALQHWLEAVSSQFIYDI